VSAAQAIKSGICAQRNGAMAYLRRSKFMSAHVNDVIE
jgi:hypothetical protein